MKRIICRFTYSSTVTIITLLFCIIIILASPLISKAGPAAPGAETKTSEAAGIEARIIAFHSKLKITEAQEGQWNKLAQVMRENAITMNALIKVRTEKGNTLNAVEDLKSYSEITDAHAAGLHKFIPVFEVLYAGMSEAQKKNADKIFTQHSLKKLKGK